MRTVKVLYFASLRELLGKAEEATDIVGAPTALSVWEALNPSVDFPDACLIAINQEYAGPEVIVNGGDELAFFPPVTGG